MFTFFTELARKDVLDRRGRYVGHPYDFIAELAEAYPRVITLIVSRGVLRKKYFIVPWKDVHQANGSLHLKVPVESLEKVFSYAKPDEMTLRRNILDQQVVDTFNRKIVRVNDIHFLKVDDDLRLAHVDIGLRGLVRRLGCEKIVDLFVRVVNHHAAYLTNESFISWKYVQPLSVHDATGKLKLSVEADKLADIPPPDVSTMLMELDPYVRAALLKSLDVQSQVDIITELDLKCQKDLVDDLDVQTAVKLFEKMPADEATDLASSMPARDADRILSQLSPKKSREISDLMKHEADSAGGLMTKELITLREGMTVGEAIDHIRHVEIKKAETIYSAFVVDDEGKLIGSVSFRRLLLEPNEMKIGDVMLTKPPSINVGDAVKDVAFVMDKYNLNTIPVVNDKGVLEGIITVDDVFHIAVEDAWGKRGSV